MTSGVTLNMLESKKKLLNEVNFRNAITRNLLSRHSRHFHDKSKHLGVRTSRILKQNLSCIRKMLYIYGYNIRVHCKLYTHIIASVSRSEAVNTKK